MKKPRDNDPRPSELVIVEDSDRSAVLVPALCGLRPFSSMAAGSFDPDAAGAKERYYNLSNAPSAPPEEWHGKAWATKDIAVCIRQGESDGEVGTYIALCLVGPDGRFIATGSTVVIGQLQRLMSDDWYGPPPWHPALPLVLTPTRSRGGRTYYSLSVATQTLPQE